MMGTPAGQQGPGGMRPPYSTPTPQNHNGGGSVSSQQSVMYARQQQLAAMQNASLMAGQSTGGQGAGLGAGNHVMNGVHGGMLPGQGQGQGGPASGLDPRMQNQYQQMMQMAAAQSSQQQQPGPPQQGHGARMGMMPPGAGAGAGMPGQMGPPPSAAYPGAQMAQYQAMQAHQQAQMQQQQQQQQQQYAAAAPSQKGRLAPAPTPRTKPSLPMNASQAHSAPTGSQPPSAMHGPPGAGANPAAGPAADDEISTRADILDHLNARQLAINRFAKHHDALSAIFDPWKLDSIVLGKKRKRELEDALKMGRNPLHGGFAGASQEGQLSALACTAVRAQLTKIEPGPLANLLATVDRNDSKLTLQERRAALIKMKEVADKDVLHMEQRFEERVKSIQATPQPVMVNEASVQVASQ